MASNKGPTRPSMYPSVSDDVFSTTTTERPGSASTIITHSQHASDSFAALKSPPSFLSPQLSRDVSPSRQWLSPTSTFESKDMAGKGVSQTMGPVRSASVPAENDPINPSSNPHRSLSTVNPVNAKPSSLNEAVNRLWRLQKANGSLENIVPVSHPTNAKDQSSIASQRTGNSTAEGAHATNGALSLVQDGDGTSDPSYKSITPTQAAFRPSRGNNTAPSLLETVDEADPAVSPTRQLESSASSFTHTRDSGESFQDHAISDVNKDDTISIESGEGVPLSRTNTVTPQVSQDQKEKRSDSRRESSSRSAAPITRQRLTSLVPTKVRGASDAPQNMIVETETVPSIPQTFINSASADRSGSGRREDSGALARRASNETIKPRKERKKTTKKAPSLISGTTSSRADLFEAKIASAVDEDSSDSDETFVYESNPPEPRARHHRDHSRTPSVTSMQSMADRRSGRYGHYLEGSRRLRGKRSMKFASSQYSSNNVDSESGDGGSTPKASQARTGLAGEGQNKHLGAYDRGSIRDNTSSAQDSPFSQASRVRNLRGHDFRDYSKSQSLNRPPSRGSYKKSESSPYDVGRDNGDDERTPLVGSIRSQRTRGPRRPDLDPEQLSFYEDGERHWLGRVAGCIFMFIAILLFVMGAATFIFATTKPLFDVRIQQIQNVLASEQEIMLDLLVKAINPNIVAITIADMDLNIFAKSTRVNGDDTMTDDEVSMSKLIRSLDGLRVPTGKHGSVDHGTDPIEDPSSDPHTMLLGRVLEFDSALTFDPSPWRHVPQSSSGELRLRRPGNKTEEGGSEKWEKVVVQSFELVVRGILKYQLPLSTRTFTASVGASVIVHPEAGIDGDGVMKLVKVKKAYWAA